MIGCLLQYFTIAFLSLSAPDSLGFLSLQLASMLRGGVSFNLALSSEEKAARAAVVLPHMFHLHGADGSGEAAAPKGSVYVSDSDEEIDDEDLDEDLDV